MIAMNRKIKIKKKKKKKKRLGEIDTGSRLYSMQLKHQIKYTIPA